MLGGGRDTAGHGHDTANRACNTAEVRAQPGQVRMLRYKVCIVSRAAPGRDTKKKRKIISWLRGATLDLDTAQLGAAIRRSSAPRYDARGCDKGGNRARQGAQRHGRTCLRHDRRGPRYGPERAMTRRLAHGLGAVRAQCAHSLGLGCASCAPNPVWTHCTVLSHCLDHYS